MADFGFRRFYIIGYLEKDGKYLMFHRNRRKHPYLTGWWGGIIGEKRDGELIYEAMERILTEETGLTSIKLRYRSMVEFWWNPRDFIGICYFDFKKWTGELRTETPLGTYQWVPKEKVHGKMYNKLERGDRMFLKLNEENIKYRFAQFVVDKDGVPIAGNNFLRRFTDEEMDWWNV